MTTVIQVRPLLLFVDGDLFYSELSPIHSIIRESDAIYESKRPQNCPRDPQSQSTEWLYLISDRLDCEITRTLRRENLPIRIAHKSHTLRQALTQHTTERICNRTNCPISSTNLCLNRRTVYQLTCKTYGKFYIGSTTRFLHDRVKSIWPTTIRPWKKHLITCHHNTQFTVAPTSLLGYSDIFFFSHSPWWCRGVE